VEDSPSEGRNGSLREEVIFLMGSRQQKAEQLLLPLLRGKGKALNAQRVVEDRIAKDKSAPSIVEECFLLEKVLERENLIRALKQVKSNRGVAGVDGMTVSELPGYLKENWVRIKEELLSGNYYPSPVLRTQIPKTPKEKRDLGIPTVLDRFIQQALNQILQPIFEPYFSDHSHGFRPNRSAHEAIRRAQRYIGMGRTWVVDIDLEKFFDRVNHDLLMSLVSKRIKDKRILKLIRRYLESGIMDKGVFHRSPEGTPQGGPLSPLLSNIMLDVLDKELEKRGHRFCRYADDSNVYVRSRRAGLRVMKSLKSFIALKLKLKVNERKSHVDQVWNRKFLGFTFSQGYKGKIRRRVAPESIVCLKNRIREITKRTKGKSLPSTISALKEYLLGWMGYFGISEVKGLFRELDKWVRRRLRAVLWKQWGRRGYKELRKRGISRDLAWNTCKSAHGPWRLSHSPALEIALPVSYFDKLGLPQMGNMIKQ
jgi:RNA-directed DNA polymerase